MADGQPRRRRTFNRNGVEYEYDRTLSDEMIDSIEQMERERNRVEEDRQRRYEEWAVAFNRGNARVQDNPLREEEERMARRRAGREQRDRENFMARQAVQSPTGGSGGMLAFILDIADRSEE